MKRKFEVEFTGNVTLELEQSVLDEVDESFKKNIYNLDTLEKIVQHLAYNLVINQFKLSDMDGWIYHDNSDARILEEDWDLRVTETK